VPGYEAPVNLAYSARNRSAAVRIPTYSESPKSKRLEYRPPDPAANPYLCFAALLMAGLDGVENKINPGEPLDKNIYELPPEELKKVPNVAGSLTEAMNASKRTTSSCSRATSSPKISSKCGFPTSERNTTPSGCVRIRTNSSCITTCKKLVRRRNWGTARTKVRAVFVSIRMDLRLGDSLVILPI